jgi:hypothetical protein
MFLSDVNKELLIELIRDLPGEMSTEEIETLMKQFPTGSEPLLETNKKFLIYYLKVVNETEPIKTTPIMDSLPEKIPVETLMMEISFVKQELIELKKMMAVLIQLIQQNSTISQLANRD